MLETTNAKSVIVKTDDYKVFVLDCRKHEGQGYQLPVGATFFCVF